MKIIIYILILLTYSCDEMKNEKMEIKQLITNLKSLDQIERSNAAVKLVELNYSKSIEVCIITINDNADELHLNYTPSVHCLINIGFDALKPLSKLLTKKDEMTRLRAMTAIENITLNIWKNKYPKDEEKAIRKWIKWWKKIGLDKDVKIQDCKKARKKLKSWIKKKEAKK